MKRWLLLGLLLVPATGLAGVYAKSFDRPVPMFTSASCIERPIGLYEGRVHTYEDRADGGFRIEGGPYGGPFNYVLFMLGVF